MKIFHICKPNVNFDINYFISKNNYIQNLEKFKSEFVYEDDN